MILCEYGCGNEGKYLLSNGKHCCCDNYNKCPSNKKKNSDAHKTQQFKECPYCHKMIVCNIGGQYKKHIESCSKIYGKKIFLQSKDASKYLNWYNKIIKYRIDNPLINGYRERHHILPKSLGGSNSKTNLVYLTAKEHYICHMLLVEIYRNDRNSYLKMLSAFLMMKSRNINSIMYAKYREKMGLAKKGQGLGELNNNYGNRWITNLNTKELKLVSNKNIDEYLSNGWILGRIINWDNYYAKENNISLNNVYYNQKKNGKSIEEIIQQKNDNILAKEKHRNEMIILYNKYYEEYKINGFKGVVAKYHYNKSKVNLINQFHRYVPNF